MKDTIVGIGVCIDDEKEPIRGRKLVLLCSHPKCVKSTLRCRDQHPAFTFWSQSQIALEYKWRRSTMLQIILLNKL